MSSDIQQDIIDSIEDISELLSSYDTLFQSVKIKNPDRVELAALGTIMHSFYNGIEGIFLYVAKNIDKTIPDDSSWHQSLLKQVTGKTENRSPVISKHSADLLAPYIKFRHFFRHAYTFMLNWQQMKPLVDDLHSVWVTVKNDIELFNNTIEKEGENPST